MKIYTGLIDIRAAAVATSMAMAMFLTACSTSDEVKLDFADCAFPDAPTESAPGWVCDQPVEGVAVSAVGVAEKSAAGYSFMKNMAATDARVQLAQAMKVHVQNMVKQYAETTGAADSETVDKVNTSVTKQITDESLVGTKVFKTITSPEGDLYVLLGMDAASAATATQNALKTSMNNDKALWQQFKAQKGQDELAASIANMKE
ncbi:MAG: LPP20 family lipoprotein [Gammaproteobacteria bacterium]|nr:LPP20 family lipoprotein [Gammaproteobacteria bacterium]